MDKLVLIDGHSILNRAFYGIRDLTNSKGIHTNAVYGFLNTLFKIISEEKPKYLAVAFDLSGPTFRHEMYKEYKGTRKGMPDELREQVPIIKDVLTSMGIKLYMKSGLEADDIIGTVSTHLSDKVDVSIVSGDRDLLQLSSDNICIRIPKTKSGVTEIENYFPDDVLNKYFVEPKGIIDLKALMGDASDNIPGVPGVGEKTATKLLVEYKTLDNIYSNIESIKPDGVKNKLIDGKESAYLSYKLATIDTDADLEFALDDMLIKDLFNADSYKLYKELELKRFYSKFENINLDSKESNNNEKNIDNLNCYSLDKSNVEKVKSMILESDFLSLGHISAINENKPLLNSMNSQIISITSNDLDIYYISTDNNDLVLMLEELIDFAFQNKKILITYDYKNLLHTLNINDKHIDSTEDIGLMSYVLNSHIKDISNIQNILNKKFPDNFTSLEQYKKCATITALLKEEFLELIEELKKLNLIDVYKEIDKKTLLVLRDVEEVGIEVDRFSLSKYNEYLSKEINKLEKEIYKDAGEEFNINSPKKLGEILFDKMKIPPVKKTKTGYSTDASVLEELSEKYEIASKIIKYRTYAKLNSTYAIGLQRYISSDNRIYGHFHQDVTATGRISSSDPNLQNIPIREEVGKKMREIFVPKEGYIFVDADYSQIELRILASLSGDEKMINAFNKDMDIHQNTAALIYNVKIDEVTSQMRRNAKAVNFGIVYGISDFGLSKDIGIPMKQAKEFIDSYFETYPTIKKYLDNVVEFAKENGYVKTCYGRVRQIPEIQNSNYQIREFGKRIAKNSPIQGSAADIMKIAMINVRDRFIKENLKSRIVVQVHDELLVETKIEEKEIVEKILKQEMENAGNLDVKLVVDINAGTNWLEAH